MNSHITLSHLSFAWPDGVSVLHDITGAFSENRTGLIGDNGTGKSTLLRLIAGLLTPTSGSIETVGEVAYLPQSVQTGNGTVADLLGIRAKLDALAAIEHGSCELSDYETIGDDWDIHTKAEAMIAGLRLPGLGAVDLHRAARTLSGGEAMAVAVAGVRLRQAPITLLDEPTNSMDARTRSALIGLVESWPRALVVVSHDVDLLNRVDSIAELDQGGLTVFGGAYSAWAEAIQVEAAAAAQALRTARQEVRAARRVRAATMERTDKNLARGKKKAIKEGLGKDVRNGMRNTAEAGAGRSRGEADVRLREAEAALDAADERVRVHERIVVDLPDPGVPQGKKILELTSPDGRSFIMAGPERVCLAGDNGVGKTTLIEQMLGYQTRSPSGILGRLFTDRVGYLPQTPTQSLDESDRSVLEIISGLAPEVPVSEIRNRLARMLVRGDAVFRPVRTLSGGERFRVVVAGLLFATPPAQLLILDEPTNNLDLRSIEQLVEALSNYRGAVLVVSHNPQFIRALEIDTVVEMTRPFDVRPIDRQGESSWCPSPARGGLWRGGRGSG